MAAGLGTLKELKARLLPATQQAVTTWDVMLSQIGAGVAAQFDQFTNRTLTRTADLETICRADRLNIALPCYPLESVASVEMKDDETSGYLSIGLSSIWTWEQNSGLLRFAGRPGPETSWLRITSTGGYWYNTNEGTPDTQPANSFLLPYDLKEAWFEMCETIWAATDRLGLSASSKKPEEKSAAKSVRMSDFVKQTLSSYTRFSML